MLLGSCYVQSTTRDAAHAPTHRATNHITGARRAARTQSTHRLGGPVVMEMAPGMITKSQSVRCTAALYMVGRGRLTMNWVGVCE